MVSCGWSFDIFTPINRFSIRSTRTNQTGLVNFEIFGEHHLVDGPELLHLHYLLGIQLYLISQKHQSYIGTVNASLFVLPGHADYWMECDDNVYELLSLSRVMKWLKITS